MDVVLKPDPLIIRHLDPLGWIPGIMVLWTLEEGSLK